MEYLLIIAGIIAGSFVTWLFTRKKSADFVTKMNIQVHELENQLITSNNSIETLQERIQFYTKNIDEIKNELHIERDKSNLLTRNLAQRESELKSLSEKLQEQTAHVATWKRPDVLLNLWPAQYTSESPGKYTSPPSG